MGTTGGDDWELFRRADLRSVMTFPLLMQKNIFSSKYLNQENRKDVYADKFSGD